MSTSLAFQMPLTRRNLQIRSMCMWPFWLRTTTGIISCNSDLKNRTSCTYVTTKICYFINP